MSQWTQRARPGMADPQVSREAAHQQQRRFEHRRKRKRTVEEWQRLADAHCAVRRAAQQQPIDCPVRVLARVHEEDAKRLWRQRYRRTHAESLLARRARRQPSTACQSADHHTTDVAWHMHAFRII